MANYTKCDSCGKEVKDSWAAEWFELERPTREAGRGYKSWDFCCLYCLQNWVNSQKGL